MKLSRIKKLFSMYDLEKVLYGLWVFRESYENFPVQLVYTTSIAIEYCQVGDYEKSVAALPEPVISQLVTAATSFCLDSNSINRDLSTEPHDAFYFLLQRMANQLPVQQIAHDDFARALVLFDMIPSDILSLGDDCKFNIPDLFLLEMGYTVKQYIQTCFIAFSATTARGIFDGKYLKEAVNVTRGTTYETLNQVMKSIAISAQHYNRERKKHDSRKSLHFHPILFFPLIRPWSDISYNDDRKRYVAPLPHLIATKAQSGIYHHFLTKYGKSFPDFFGKEIFERYVKRCLDHCDMSDKIYDEQEIAETFKLPKGVSNPDFIIAGQSIGIIVECKAARFPLPVLLSGGKGDFETTFKKLFVATTQITKFNKFIKSAHCDALKKTQDWVGVIITYERLWGMSGELLSEVVAKDFLTETQLEEFQHNLKNIAILSIGELDVIQTLISDEIPFGSVVQRLLQEDFHEVVDDLSKQTGRGVENSHLYSVFKEFCGEITGKQSICSEALQYCKGK